MPAKMRFPSTLVTLLAASIVGAGCGSDGGIDQSTRAIASSTSAAVETSEVLQDPAGGSADSERSSPSGRTGTSTPSIWPVDPTTVDPETPPTWRAEIIESYPHDPDAFTQGLELVADGTLLESTGLRGFSTIRLVDLESGQVTASAELDPTEFGEGATRVGDTIIQLTWQEGVARRWALPELTILDPFTYQGEGWGLCLAENRLAMSDGTSTITWRDPSTFAVLDTVDVRLRGEPVTNLNELECVDDHVIANVWFGNFLVVVRSDGEVVATIDAGDVIAATQVAMSGDVLNGVADLGDGTLLLGGKRWPTFYRVRLVDG